MIVNSWFNQNKAYSFFLPNLNLKKIPIAPSVSNQTSREQRPQIFEIPLQ